MPIRVDAELRPHPDQWAYVAAIQLMSAHDIEPIILRATGGVHLLDVTFIDDEDMATPWRRDNTVAKKLAGPMPESLTITVANLIYLEKAQLPQALVNRLIRLAAFQNSEFYRAQAMRMSVWDKPGIIGCAENYPQHIALPRGCFEAAQALLKDRHIRCKTVDERFAGDAIDIHFAGTLRPDQEAAALAMLRHDTGVLCAPTAFGKTVTTAAMIARRGVNALVLAMPVAWKGTLRQYAGCLHREHAGEIDVRIIDFVDTGHPALLRMWGKRQRGYRAMGYRVGQSMQRGSIDPTLG